MPCHVLTRVVMRRPVKPFLLTVSTREQRAERREQTAESREQRAESRQSRE
jgi:hypothetical protein